MKEQLTINLDKRIKAPDETLWDVNFDVYAFCVQKGTFSQRAEDPEEYFGVYNYELERINYAIPDGEDDAVEVVPEWLLEKLTEMVEDFN